MNRNHLLAPLAIILLLIALVAGCDKERIVESTEVIHEIEYIELPPDTVVIFDTVMTYDSVTIQTTDTLVVFDTVVEVNTIYDTVVQVNTIYDTVIQINTIYDTVTTIVIDTVIQASNEANELLAKGALEFYVDPLVLEFAYQQLGLNGGWIYYLSGWQMDFTRRSAGVYDIYGYIEYWAIDWSGYYPLEFYYRVSHTGGDPADVTNWELGEPSSGSPGHTPGLKSVAAEKQTTGAMLR